jgi:hypothetical protein
VGAAEHQLAVTGRLKKGDGTFEVLRDVQSGLVPESESVAALHDTGVAGSLARFGILTRQQAGQQQAREGNYE